MKSSPDVSSKKSNSAKNPVESSYISAEDRVLDPSKLELSVIERMPQPAGWRLLVLPYRGKGQTDGGILLQRPIVVRSERLR